MENRISTQTRREVVEQLRQRYREAGKPEKSRILDEFVALTKCHRKHAIRLLVASEAQSGQDPPSGLKDRRLYDEAVRKALVVTWEASDGSAESG